MEKLVEAVMRTERETNLLDHVVLAIGAMSLCLALAGTLLGANSEIAQDSPGQPSITAV